MPVYPSVRVRSSGYACERDRDGRWVQEQRGGSSIERASRERERKMDQDILLPPALGCAIASREWNCDNRAASFTVRMLAVHV